jgi:hypothetical protein
MRTWEKKQEGHLECTSNVCRNGVHKENKSANAAKNKCAFYGTNPSTWQLKTSNIK